MLKVESKNSSLLPGSYNLLLNYLSFRDDMGSKLYINCARDRLPDLSVSGIISNKENLDFSLSLLHFDNLLKKIITESYPLFRLVRFPYNSTVFSM